MNNNQSLLETRKKALNKYLSLVFSYLMLALGICGATSFLVSKWKKFMEFYAKNPFLMLTSTFIPTIFLLAYLCHSTQIKNNTNQSSLPMILIAFVAFAGFIGLSLAPIFLIYTNSSIFTAFFISSIIFGLAALNGVTTKRDLSNWGPSIFLGIIGISTISLINYFLESKPIDYIIGIIGVILFTACVAYEFNKVKINFNENESELQKNKNAIYDAITTFLTFINLFLKILEIIGEAKKSAAQINKDNLGNHNHINISNFDNSAKIPNSKLSKYTIINQYGNHHTSLSFNYSS
jgi:FtsH-binding integral membrane protein